MRFMALACDYDGTLATHGLVHTETVRALERFIKSGRRLLLVTGRELTELLHIFPQLDLFEWVVAENGGLLYHPATKTEAPLSEAPEKELVAELQRRGVRPMSVGRTIVATWEPHETTVLRAIRDLGLELQVIFNKGAVMVLPSGVNKATGLAAALEQMKLSPHNVVGIGDAENDHALLGSCEAGAAVFNAVPLLKEHADYVTVADHGEGVQELIDMILEDDLRSLEPKLARHHLLVGSEAQGADLKLTPFRSNVLIAGSSGGGKTSVSSALVERLIDRDYQVCVIDPEGDYDEFEGTVSVGTSNKPPDLEPTLKLLDSPHQNVVVNMVGLSYRERPEFFVSLFRRLQELRARYGRPHWIVIDEAHHVWTDQMESENAAGPHGAKNTLLITLEPQSLPPSALSTIDMVLAVGKAAGESLSAFASAADQPFPTDGHAALTHGDLLAWCVGNDRAVQIKALPARTQHRRHVRKYAEGEMDEDRSFYVRGRAGKM